MTVEIATKISELVATNPAGSDPKSEGDNHLRLIKGVLQDVFDDAGATMKTTLPIESPDGAKFGTADFTNLTADTVTTDDLTVTDDMTIAGDLAVTGNATMGGTLNVTGKATAGILRSTGAAELPGGMKTDNAINVLKMDWVSPAVRLIIDGSDQGRVFSTANCPINGTSPGYQKFLSGLILQWGVVTQGLSDFNYAFPSAFPNFCFAVVGWAAVSGTPVNTLYGALTSNITRMAFDIRTRTVSPGSVVGATNCPVYWLAVGI